MNQQNEHHTYIIPPNFVESGTFFGGMFKARNVAEAGILAAVVSVPVFTMLPFSLTVRIIILCLTALPLALFALIGVSGESLSSFLAIFLKYLKNRRVVGGEGTAQAVPLSTEKGQKTKAASDNAPKKRIRKEDFPAEFDEVRGYELRQKLHPAKPGRVSAPVGKKASSQDKTPGTAPFLNPAAGYFPITKIENGIIYTKDRRYIKIVEVVPINFLLRSEREQQGIIHSFISYLKISPMRMQFKVLTRRADINRHTENIQREMLSEQIGRAHV